MSLQFQCHCYSKDLHTPPPTNTNVCPQVQARDPPVPRATFFRDIDTWVVRLARSDTHCTNAEIDGRDHFKKFPHGLTGYVFDGRRIDGGWHIAVAAHLHVFLCTCPLLSLRTRVQFGNAFTTLFAVHHGLRDDLPKQELPQYTARIKRLLDQMLPLCEPHLKKQCNSIKFHWPLHWGDTRRQLGCSAAEKSLERKLGESQKRNYKFSNKKQRSDHEVMFSAPPWTLAQSKTRSPNHPQSQQPFWFLCAHPSSHPYHMPKLLDEFYL